MIPYYLVNFILLSYIYLFIFLAIREKKHEKYKSKPRNGIIYINEKEYYFINDVNYSKDVYHKIIEKISENEKKISIKYAREWYRLCDQPGKKIWDINLNKTLNGIKELNSKYLFNN